MTWLIVILSLTRGVMATIATFEKLPFVEAIDALQQRVDSAREGIDAARLTASGVGGKARIKAFESEVGIIIDTWNAALSTMKDGGSLRDFRLQLPKEMDKAGWTGSNPYRSTLVFATQSYMAYEAGRFQQYGELGIQHWRFKTLEDELVCPICGRLDDRSFSMEDRTFWPPVHFHCRCTTEPIFDTEKTGKVWTGDGVWSQVRGLTGAEGDQVKRIWERTLNSENSLDWDPEAYLKNDVANLPVKIPPDLLPVVQRLAAIRGVKIVS